MQGAKGGEGSTRQLLQLCACYFSFYVVTGVTVKYFLGKPADGFPGMDGVEFLVYSTAGGTSICLAIVLALRWYRLQSNGPITWGGLRFPREYLYIIPSGICTAVVIPTTTLMYTLGISVMVAMVMMRGSVIVISRAVDALQIRQGILKRKVYREEDVAVAFALGAVAVGLGGVKAGDFDFVHSPAAVTILGSYIVAYAIRIYLMNYFKNTRAAGVKLDNKGFFAVEQIAAAVVMLGVGIACFFSASRLVQISVFHQAIVAPRPLWGWALLAGGAYGMVAFFSVFIFMFKGKTATFAGLVNRLTSLVAGTTATLILAFAFGGAFPSVKDWVSLLFILVAVGFLSLAERKRASQAATARREAAVGIAPAI
ncbi:MAG: hypothetical protein EXR72_02085 [Myxococcales bacterium]|nr:hypothetical protein [Myxococcales bacterium]